MPRGLKETSALITISCDVVETAANTFTSERIDLQLNPLDQEVFIVYGVDLDCREPDMNAGANSLSTGSLSTTQRTTVGTLNDSNVMAASRTVIQNDGVTAVVTEFKSDSTPVGDLPYIGIISTNDFFLNILGTGNSAAKSMSAKVYGVRAKAEASIYAALVNSEMLSA